MECDLLHCITASMYHDAQSLRLALILVTEPLQGDSGPPNIPLMHFAPAYSRATLA